MADEVVVKLQAENDQYNKEFQKSTKITEGLGESVDGVNKEVKTLGKESKTQTGKAGKEFEKFGRRVNQVIAALAIKQFIGSIVQTTAEFQKLQAVLENTLGSRSAADRAFRNIQKFAATTNFSVLELTDSFVKLTNQGFQPTVAELGNLGDLANSTGKSFDQLAEAIIDAQVGEFERLKEFGIRAQKEGDNVKFTFKGVETQVKFTNSAIRKYILGLGDLQGVSGSTAKISETLGGSLSNFKDALDNLFFSLGDSDSLLGSFLQKFIKLGTATINSLAPSEKLSDLIRKQQEELNVLVTRATNAAIAEDDRRKVIDEIQKRYPDFLTNLNKEKVSNEQLSARLRQVNKDFVDRIVLQQQQEKLQEQAAIVAAANTKAAQAQIGTDRVLSEIALKLNKSDEIQNKNLSERVVILTDAAKAAQEDIELRSQLNLTLGDLRFTLLKLERAESDLQGSRDRAANQEKQLSFLTEERTKILNALGINQERENELTAQNNGLLQQNTEDQDENNTGKEKSIQLTEEQIKLEQKRREEAIKNSQEALKAEQAQETIFDLLQGTEFDQSAFGDPEVRQRLIDDLLNFSDIFDQVALDQINAQNAIAENDKAVTQQRIANAIAIANTASTLLSALGNDNKDAAIAAAIIDTLAGAAAVFAQTPGEFFIKSLAASAALAQGFARVAQIRATDVPEPKKFHKGTGYVTLDGNPPGVDTVPSMLTEGEGVVTRKYNDPELVAAMNKGLKDNFINQRYVIPALKAQQKEFEEQQQKSFAQNISNSLMFNNFNDTNLLRSEKMTRHVLKGIYEELKKDVDHKPYV